jgi:hypothetical protein
MKIAGRLALITIICALAGAAAQAPRSSYDPAQKNQQTHRDSFIDFALKRINPGNEDYGQQIEDVRGVVIARTIDNLLFWSNSCALVLLAAAFVVVLHQTKERKHRQIIAARFLTWYHNELLAARARTFEEVGKLERLRKALDARTIPVAVTPQAPTARTNGDRDLMVENNSLRQKVALLEQSEKTLRQQNVHLSRLLREEQQKNHTSRTAAPADTSVRKEGTNGKG